jgi:hypothetical protein
MYISLSDSRAGGFKKWSGNHPPGNNDNDHPGGATPIAVTEPPDEGGELPVEAPHRPWIVPGIAGAF